jgi:glycine oxidase
VGRLEPGLFVASGHYRSGISMAPRTGAVIADLLEGTALEPDALDLDPLRPHAGWRRT